VSRKRAKVKDFPGEGEGGKFPYLEDDPKMAFHQKSLKKKKALEKESNKGKGNGKIEKKKGGIGSLGGILTRSRDPEHKKKEEREKYERIQRGGGDKRGNNLMPRFLWGTWRSFRANGRMGGTRVERKKGEEIL